MVLVYILDCLLKFKLKLLVKVDKNANPVRKHFLINLSILVHYVIFIHQIIVNVYNTINCNSMIVNTKIINITIKYSLFFFSYYLMTSLLKCFLGIMELLHLRIFCFKLVDFCTINKTITICSI